jgi:hypothetical protein
MNRSKFISLAIVALLFGAALFLLTGCVTVPVPPFGDRRGELGNLQVAVSVKYIPTQNPDIPGDRNLQHAWEQFGLAKALKDK